MQHAVQRLVPSLKLLFLSLLFLSTLQIGLATAMRFYHVPPALLSMAVFSKGINAANNTTSVDLSWHPPVSSNINNLNTAINGSGIYGFIFNSSILPAGVPYGIEIHI